MLLAKKSYVEIARAGEFVLDVLTKARAFDIDYHQLELVLKMAEVYPLTFKSTHSLIQQIREFRDTSHALFKYLWGILNNVNIILVTKSVGFVHQFNFSIFQTFKNSKGAWKVSPLCLSGQVLDLQYVWAPEREKLWHCPCQARGGGALRSQCKLLTL
jgi:hypothetical protein